MPAGIREEHSPAIYDDRMACIVSPLIAGHNIKMAGQQINNLTFTFVAPLGADDN